MLYGWTVDGSEPLTPEEVAENYGLPVVAVQEAINYCGSSPPELAEDQRREKAVMQATGMDETDYKSGGKYRLLSPQERARLGL